jgi:hypothetical protein
VHVDMLRPHATKQDTYWAYSFTITHLVRNEWRYPSPTPPLDDAFKACKSKSSTLEEATKAQTGSRGTALLFL